MKTINIIGSTHRETDLFKPMDIKKYLDKINPEIILLELSSEFFDDAFNLIEDGSEGIEEKAVLLYLKDKPTPIRPIDIEGRNRFYRENRVFKLQDEIFSKINNLYEDDKLTEQSRLRFRSFLQLIEMESTFIELDFYGINTQLVERVASAKNRDVRELEKIIFDMDGLSCYRDFIIKLNRFEDSRNRAMVNNTLKWMESLRLDKGVIICGVNHKPQLRRLFEECGKIEVCQF